MKLFAEIFDIGRVKNLNESESLEHLNGGQQQHEFIPFLVVVSVVDGLQIVWITILYL